VIRAPTPLTAQRAARPGPAGAFQASQPVPHQNAILAHERDDIRHRAHATRSSQSRRSTPATPASLALSPCLIRAWHSLNTTPTPAKSRVAGSGAQLRVDDRLGGRRRPGGLVVIGHDQRSPPPRAPPPRPRGRWVPQSTVISRSGRCAARQRWKPGRSARSRLEAVGQETGGRTAQPSPAAKPARPSRSRRPRHSPP